MVEVEVVVVVAVVVVYSNSSLYIIKLVKKKKRETYLGSRLHLKPTLPSMVPPSPALSCVLRGPAIGELSGICVRNRC